MFQQLVVWMEKRRVHGIEATQVVGFVFDGGRLHLTLSSGHVLTVPDHAADRVANELGLSNDLLHPEGK